MASNDEIKITVNRVLSDNEATLSTVGINGMFECFGLEDEYRVFKIPQETRIPAGTYNVGLRTVGGFNAKYQVKFRDLHKGMLHIEGVPNFENVLIHIGNDDEDTAGCLLVGANATTTDRIKVLASSIAYRELYIKVVSAAQAGKLTIQFIDSDQYTRKVA